MSELGNGQHRDRSVSRIVGANMRVYRKRLGMSQDELGRQLGGWSKQVVSAAERCADPDSSRLRTFAIDEVVTIAKVLGVDIADLLVPIPPCPCCGDEPAPGMTCQVCKVEGLPFGSPDAAEANGGSR